MMNRQWSSWRTVERVLLSATLAVCIFVAAQPLWQHLVAWQSQRTLQSQWQQAAKAAHSSVQNAHKATSTRSPGRANPSLSRPVAQPPVEDDSQIALWPLTRLSCSKMKLDAIVVDGTDAAQLQSGPGHEIGTSWPGGNNCVIAAHRNAYGWWFYHLNLLKKGDSITLQVSDRKLTYQVVATRTVSVRDTSILHWRAKNASRLTLYTCTLPKTTQRLVVVANLKSSQPS